MAGGASPTTLTPLYPTGYNLSDAAQAMAFLSQILDDGILQISGEEYARNFWYGVVVVIGLAAIVNLIWRLKLKLRYLDSPPPSAEHPSTLES
jgi:ferric-chelate reductase